MRVYDHPEYYEIAFGYQDVKRQVDFFEEVARRFSGCRVRRFLDIGCGPSPQLREIARRGYEAVGLDKNPKMLTYLRQKALEEGLRVKTVQADMANFRLKRRCDFAFTLSGSLYVDSNEEFLKHLRCVGNALNAGGLYLLENVALELKPCEREEWTMKKGDIEIKTTFEAIQINQIEQIFEGKLVFEVNDHGTRKELVSIEKSKDFAPQELRSLVDLSGEFRFLSFFEHLSLRPLKERRMKDNFVLMQKLRRTHREFCRTERTVPLA